MARKKKTVAKVSNKVKIAAKKKELAENKGKKKRGRPATKKPIVGWEVGSKDQNRIANDFSEAQKFFDSIGENVSKFAFDAAPDSAMAAVRDIVKFQKQMKTMCKTIRTIKKNMKPKFGEVATA